jgi:hypothetical protein
MIRIYALVLCALALLLCAPAFAQLDTGVILGRVTDPAGAVVPGAKITVVATELNFEYQTETTSDGNYRVPALRPGPYRVTVIATGFKQLVREGLSLQMGENMAVDLRLEVGAVAESVRVTAAAPILDTQTSSTGQVMEGDYYYKMPTNQRWTRGIMYQTPGVSYNSAPWAGSLGNFSILGQGGVGVYEDGVVAFRQNGGDSVDTIANSIEEVKVLTSALPAEYGHTVTGAISVVKKTGSNELHGMANEGVYTRSMQHRKFFDQKTTTQLGVHTVQWQPDFNVGGPVYLPKLYNGKNKTFFFMSGQFMYGTSSPPSYYNVPTPDMAAGIYNTFPAGVASNTIYDPATLRQDASGKWYRDPLPNNIVPQNRFSKVAAALLNPNPFNQPNVPGSWSTTGPTQNIYGGFPQYIMYDTYTWRVDQQIGNNIKAYTSTTVARKTPEGINKTNMVLSNMLYDPGASTLHTWQSDPSVGMIWSITPTLISETRVGQYRFTNNPVSPDQFLITKLFTKAGIPNIGEGWYLPQLNLYGNNQQNQSLFGQRQQSVTVQNTRDLREDVTKVWGSHAFKMGYEFLWNNQITHNIPNLNASFSYTGTSGIQTNGTTTLPNTGNRLAEFQMGYVGGYSFTKQTSAWLPITSNHSLYLQDDWRITPALTLNLGLRYTNENPMRTKWNQMSVWSENVKELDAAGNPVFTPTAGFSCPANGCMGGYLHNVKSFYNRDNNNIQPRFGLAWHPFDSWVFRGGFAVNTQDMNFWYSNRSEMDQSYSPSAPAGSPNGYYFFNINAGAPGNWAFPAQRADGSTPRLNPAAGNGSGTIINPDIKNPYAMSWNVSIQRQFGKDYQAQLSYEGSANVNMIGTAAWNSRPYAMIPDPNGNGWLNLADPANAAFRAGTFNTYSAYFRPWINWGNINYQSNFGHLVYHSGTAKLEKRYSGGVSFLTFLTYAKNMQWSPGNRYLDWGLNRQRVGGSNQRFRYVSSLTWELPVGKGRKFFNRGGLFDAVLGGWELAWTYSIYSGSPASISVTGNSRQDYPGYMPTYSSGGYLLKNPKLRANWQDLGGDRFTVNNQNSTIDCGAMVLNWGNDCVAAVPNYTNGNLPGSSWDNQRNIAASAAISKDVTIHDRMKWHFRFMFQNPFKWYNWTTPNNSLNIVNATNALSFGKIGLSDTGSASLGGQPMMTVELAFKW